MSQTETCRGCVRIVNLAPGEVDRILAAVLRDEPAASLADDATYQDRLVECSGCGDLRHGTTCRHCGCLVAVRAKIAGKYCPAPQPRWLAVGLSPLVDKFASSGPRCDYCRGHITWTNVRKNSLRRKSVSNLRRTASHPSPSFHYL